MADIPSGGSRGSERSASRTAPSRQRAPSLPRGGRTNVRPTNVQKTDSNPSRDDQFSHRSTSSASSFASSVFDRRKQSYDSNTSYEEEPYEKPSRRGVSSRGVRESEPTYNDEVGEGNEEQVPLETGYGASIWNRVAAVAGALTVNVSKAWETGVILGDGEVTPAGQETRLTKAMKEYYLKRARSKADLPAWLFDESERRINVESRGFVDGPSSQSKTRRGKGDYDETEPLPSVKKSRGLRDIYEQARSSSATTTSGVGGGGGRFTDGDRERSNGYAGRGDKADDIDGSRSKASSRLKAIKDSKRTGTSGTIVGRTEELQRNDDDDADAKAEYNARRVRRVGLPTGPRKR